VWGERVHHLSGEVQVVLLEVKTSDRFAPVRLPLIPETTRVNRKKATVGVVAIVEHSDSGFFFFFSPNGNRAQLSPPLEAKQNRGVACTGSDGREGRLPILRN
jgi:hypothetical protein